MVIQGEPLDAQSSAAKEKTNTASDAGKEAKGVEKMKGHPLPSILNLLTPSKVTFRDGGSRNSSSSNSSSSSSSSSGDGYGGTTRLNASPESHKSSPIPLKYSPTLSASSPTIARSSPVNVAVNRYQSQSPCSSKNKVHPTLSPQSPGCRLFTRKRKRHYLELSSLHRLQSRHGPACETIDSQIYRLAQSQPFHRDLLSKVLTMDDIGDELVVLILRYLPRDSEFLHSILLTSRRMRRVGNSHWCWVDVPDVFLPISSPSLPPHGTKLNSVEMVRKQQSGVNISGTSLRINWANFQFINCNRNVACGDQADNCSKSRGNGHCTGAGNGATINQRVHTEISHASQPGRTSASAAQGCFCSGTEGVVFKALQRNTGKFVAIKKARVSPKQEGVPYYMLRELSFLKICPILIFLS